MKKLKYFIIGLMALVLCSCYTVVETVKTPTEEVEYTYTEEPQISVNIDLYYGFYSYRYFWYDGWYPVSIIYYPYWYPYWYPTYYTYWYVPYYWYPTYYTYWYPHHRHPYYNNYSYEYNYRTRSDYKIRNSGNRNYNTEVRDGTKVKIYDRKQPVKQKTTIDRKPPVKRNTTIDRKPPVKRNTTDKNTNTNKTRNNTGKRK